MAKAESGSKVAGLGEGQICWSPLLGFSGLKPLPTFMRTPGWLPIPKGLYGRLFREDVPYISSIVQSNLAH